MNRLLNTDTVHITFNEVNIHTFTHSVPLRQPVSLRSRWLRVWPFLEGSDMGYSCS